jgi:hypothetical protein
MDWFIGQRVIMLQPGRPDLDLAGVIEEIQEDWNGEPYLWFRVRYQFEPDGKYFWADHVRSDEVTAA